MIDPSNIDFDIIDVQNPKPSFTIPAVLIVIGIVSFGAGIYLYNEYRNNQEKQS
jgi:hypothetical protein